MPPACATTLAQLKHVAIVLEKSCVPASGVAHGHYNAAALSAREDELSSRPLSHAPSGDPRRVCGQDCSQTLCHA